MCDNNYFMGKTILVTGSAGFVGTNMCLELLQRGANVIGTWHRKKPIIEHERFKGLQADLTKREDCERVTEQVDYVIMTAAYVGGSRSVIIVADGICN